MLILLLLMLPIYQMRCSRRKDVRTFPWSLERTPPPSTAAAHGLREQYVAAVGALKIVMLLSIMLMLCSLTHTATVARLCGGVRGDTGLDLE